MQYIAATVQKKTKNREKNEKTDQSSELIWMLMVFSMTWLPVEESSMSVMQLLEKHNQQWYGGELKELWQPMSMMSEVYVDQVDR